MKDQEHVESIRQAVEDIAGTIEVPPPPGNLRAVASRSSIGRRRFALAAVLLGATVMAGWLLWSGARPIGPLPAAGVEIEHLRIGGRPVSARIVSPPGVGAVVLITWKQQPAATDLGVAKRREIVVARGDAPERKENLR